MIEKLKKHLKHTHSGKVRETFELNARRDGSQLLLVVATDRVSFFDFVAGPVIDKKGEILTAMNVFWRITFPNYLHDLVAFGSKIDAFLPVELQDNIWLQKRAIVVKRLSMIDGEFIFRDYLTGSGWKDYQATAPDHKLCGYSLPAGLHDGSKLPERLFTPSTKAVEGHDENISADEFRKKYGSEAESVGKGFFGSAVEHAATRGIIIADTKMELGQLMEVRRLGQSKIAIGDEVITPDSSRFWDVDEYARAKAERKSPVSMDKQFLRNYAIKLGINKKDPKLAADREWVGQQEIPEDILEQTSKLYNQAIERIIGWSLTEFQWRIMGIGMLRT
jgi:phosphoribosylaminoimidazole-succinocarboxamide synthase